jgi:PAS domain S-box-containing protein
LSAGFAAIVFLMLAADAVALWQFTLIRRQAQQLTELEEKAVSVLRLHAGVLTFHDKLGDSIRQHDASQFASSSESLRKSLQGQLEQFAATVAVSPAGAVRDPTLLSTIETVRSALPAQLDALKDLTISGDWPAAELRLENQVKPLSALTASLVENVDLEVLQEKKAAQESIQRAERRVFRILPFTGLLTLIFAGVLGIVVTQSITNPLQELDESTQALAHGDFKHRVPVDGADELATLAGRFNDASQHLDDLYAALTSSEARFRTVVLAEPVGIAVLDGKAIVRLCNSAFLKMVGLDEQTVLGKSLSDPTLCAYSENGALCPQEEHPVFRALTTGAPVSNIVLRYGCSGGGEGTWALASAWPILKTDASVDEVILALTDFTQQKKAEEALVRSEADYRVIFENSALGIALVEASGKLLRVNPTLQRMFGYSSEELTAMTFMELTHPEDAEPSTSLFRELVEGKREGFQIKKRYLKKNGGVCWTRLSVSAMRRADKQFQYCVSMIQDITQQEMAERSMRQMSANLARIQEDEQKRIAREIHDSTGQEITGLMLTLGALNKSPDPLPPAARSKLAQCLDMAKSISSQIRTYSYLLHPPMLEEFGLWAALRIFTEEFRNRSGLRVMLRVAENLEQQRLDPDCEMTLFRLVQEALANVHRHAACTSVSIDAQRENEQVRISVADDGRGISAGELGGVGSPASGAGVGIRGMKDRVRQVGGQFEVSSDHTGTTISALIPFKPAPDGR